MDKNQSLKLASVVFGIIALLHLIRALFKWPVTIANFNISVYFSYAIFVVAGFLSWWMFKVSK